MLGSAVPLLWQIPLTVGACVAASLAAAWAISTVAGFAMHPSSVAVLSGVLSACAIAAELRRTSHQAKCSHA